MTAWLTTEDEQNYGRELLDVSQRAALHALAPTLQQIQEDNAQLRQRLAQEQRHRLDQQIEHALPDFRERDRDPRWHTWLRGIDNLSGRVRQQLLNEATASGNADRVLAFFRSFQREAGNTSAASASPGRTRSAPASNKPIYTRAQVKELYARHQRGEFAGQEAEWNRLEYDLVKASGEGRILNRVDVAGK